MVRRTSLKSPVTILERINLANTQGPIQDKYLISSSFKGFCQNKSSPCGAIEWPAGSLPLLVLSLKGLTSEAEDSYLRDLSNEPAAAPASSTKVMHA